MRLKDYAWPVIGAIAVVVSAWLLYYELRSLSLDDVVDSLRAIPLHRWLLAAAATAAAYAALAGYDRIALMHLRKSVPFGVVVGIALIVVFLSQVVNNIPELLFAIFGLYAASGYVLWAVDKVRKRRVPKPPPPAMPPDGL